MKYLLALMFLFFSVQSYANCTDGLNSEEDITPRNFENAIRCLQSEIDSIKLQNNSEREDINNTNNEQWVIQVAASTDKSFADEVRETFISNGYRTIIKISQNTEKSKASNWYKVLVGNYHWRSEAMEAKDFIKATYPRYKDAFVISMPLN